MTAVYQIEPHVRTATEVLQGLSNKTESVRAKRVLRPQNKTVTATVQKRQLARIRAMFQEAERRDPKHTKHAEVVVDGELRQVENIEREAKARAWPITVELGLDPCAALSAGGRKSIVCKRQNISSVPRKRVKEVLMTD